MILSPLFFPVTPVVGLALGSALNPRTIQEGDDAYFECDVEANPRFHRIDWVHNGKELVHNMSAGVVMSGLSLVLRKLHRRYSGTYLCTAANIEGSTTSNAVQLTVRHVPVCAGAGRPRTQGAARGSATTIKCAVEAEPAYDINWQWTKLPPEPDETQGRKVIEEENFSGDYMINDGLSSVVKLTPQDPEDYGVFKCYATNAIGRQEVGCSVQLVPAGPPDTPVNCTASPLEEVTEAIEMEEDEEASLAINCMEGFDGGLPQYFQLEAWQDGAMVANLTSQFPEWVLDGVRRGTGVTLSIAAHNARGSSDPLIMEVHTTNALQRAAPVGMELPLELPIILGAAAGFVGVFLLLLFVCLLLARKVKRQPKKPSDEVAMTPTVADSFDPDVVQSIYRRPPSLDVLPCVKEEGSEDEVGEEREEGDGEVASGSHSLKKEVSVFVHSSSCSDSFAKMQSEGDVREECLQGRSPDCSCSAKQQQLRKDFSVEESWQRQETPRHHCPSDDSGVSESESESEMRRLVSERKAAALFQTEGRVYKALPAGKSQLDARSSEDPRDSDIQPSSSSSSSTKKTTATTALCDIQDYGQRRSAGSQPQEAVCSSESGRQSSVDQRHKTSYVRRIRDNSEPSKTSDFVREMQNRLFQPRTSPLNERQLIHAKRDKGKISPKGKPVSPPDSSLSDVNLEAIRNAQVTARESTV